MAPGRQTHSVPDPVIGYRGGSARRWWGQLPLTAARSDPGMVRARGPAQRTRSPLSRRKNSHRGPRRANRPCCAALS